MPEARRYDTMLQKWIQTAAPEKLLGRTGNVVCTIHRSSVHLPN